MSKGMLSPSAKETNNYDLLRAYVGATSKGMRPPLASMGSSSKMAKLTARCPEGSMSESSALYEPWKYVYGKVILDNATVLPNRPAHYVWLPSRCACGRICSGSIEVDS